MTQKERERIMKAYLNLGMTEQEAIQAIEDDIRIDKGETCEWETKQTPEQKAMLRKLLRAESDKPKEKSTRTKKENPDKKDLIAKVSATLINLENVNGVEILNAEREISFTYNGTIYKLTLSVPRTPKN